jgi:glycosyltransferase involved in cell wall biosynthesis
MNTPLAIFTPHIGAFSETFIRRHLQDLLPGGTVVITGTTGKPFGGNWMVDCPMLVVDQIQRDGFVPLAFKEAARRMGWRPPEYIVLIKKFLKQHNVQVILAEYLDWALEWLPIAQELGIRFFGHAHGYDISMQLLDPKWQTEYLRYNHANGLFTINQVSRERLINLGVDAAKIHLIPYGVNVPAEPLVRHEQEVIRCVAVGMTAQKAPILMLDAFRRAAELVPRLRLDFVGKGELLAAVQQFVRAFNLESQVTLHGGQLNEVVQQLMRQADIFLQHSMVDPDGAEEGLPVAILEAMANALPVVSTRHAGIPEAVLEEETGFLVDEGDSLRMSEQIVLLAKDAKLRREMGRAGWQRAQQLFTWERQKQSLLQVLGLEDNNTNL